MEAANIEAVRLHADPAAVNAVIRQLDPAHKVDAIASKRPRTMAVEAFAGMGSAVRDELRREGRLALWELAGRAARPPPLRSTPVCSRSSAPWRP